MDQNKTYTIKVTKTENGFTISRHNNGFNFHELLGILEHTKMDIVNRIANDIKPDKIETKVTIDEE